jgi:hypothetical protein
MLTTIIDYLYEQHPITVKPKVEELFAPSVVSL